MKHWKHRTSPHSHALVPPTAAQTHPRSSDIVSAVTATGQVYAGTAATKTGSGITFRHGYKSRRAVVVPFPVGQPMVQPDGSVQPSIQTGSIAFSANCVNHLEPTLVTMAAGPQRPCTPAPPGNDQPAPDIIPWA